MKSRASCIDARRRLSGASDSCVADGPALPTALCAADAAWVVASSFSISCDDDLLEPPSPRRTRQHPYKPMLSLSHYFYLSKTKNKRTSPVSINQSILIYIRQPKPIVAKPIHIKETHTALYNITAQTNEKREKPSRYWSETSAAENHTCIFQRFPQIVARLIHSVSTWQRKVEQEVNRIRDKI